MNKTVHVSGSVTLTVNGEGETMAEAIRDWNIKSGAGGGSIEWVWWGDDDDSGRGVVALCENCELPIFEDQEHHYDCDGIYWHKNDADCEAER